MCNDELAAPHWSTKIHFKNVTNQKAGISNRFKWWATCLDRSTEIMRKQPKLTSPNVHVEYDAYLNMWQ